METPFGPQSKHLPPLVVTSLACAAVAAHIAFTSTNPVVPRFVDAAVRASFDLCAGSGQRDCVIDGDTFDLHDERIRVADIDAPETHPPRCDYEVRLGDLATRRLLALLNTGPFSLRAVDGRDRDVYGRKLRIVVRDGRSLGGILVTEGLARRWTGQRLPWCPRAA